MAVDTSYVQSSLELNPRWSAPEVIKAGHYSTAADVYSFGVVLWELLTWQVGVLVVRHGVGVWRMEEVGGRGTKGTFVDLLDQHNHQYVKPHMDDTCNDTHLSVFVLIMFVCSFLCLSGALG